MTRKLIQSTHHIESCPTSTHQPTGTTTSQKIPENIAEMSHRMASVLDERRDPNFNTWEEIIPQRVKEAHGLVPRQPNPRHTVANRRDIESSQSEVERAVTSLALTIQNVLSRAIHWCAHPAQMEERCQT